MGLVATISKIAPLTIKKWFRFAIKHIPKRFELPFQYWYHNLRNPAEEEMGLLKELAGEGRTVIDIGANIGFYSYVLSKFCARVEAFEPNPKCLRILRAYHAKNIKTHNVGLSSNSGVLQLYIPIVDGEESAGFASVNRMSTENVSIKIAVRKLDDYEFRQVSFVKIDVEGHESEVIIGARETLLRERPNLLIEVEQRHLNYPMGVVFDQLAYLGFNGYFLYEGKLQPLSKFSYELHQKDILGVDCARKYVNNFIFKPKI